MFKFALQGVNLWGTKILKRHFCNKSQLSYLKSQYYDFVVFQESAESIEPVDSAILFIPLEEILSLHPVRALISNCTRLNFFNGGV